MIESSIKENSFTTVKSSTYGTFDHFATECHCDQYMYIDLGRTMVETYQYGTFNHSAPKSIYIYTGDNGI